MIEGKNMLSDWKMNSFKIIKEKYWIKSYIHHVNFLDLFVGEKGGNIHRRKIVKMSILHHRLS